MIRRLYGPDSLHGSRSMFALVIVLTLVPSAFVLWFMNEAMTAESAAARQRVLEAYRGQLRLVRSRLDGAWRAQAARLNAAGAPEQSFAHVITSELADGAVVLGENGQPVYPTRANVRETATGDLEHQLTVISSLAPSSRERGVTAVAARLNDYTRPLPAADRLMLMDRLRTIAPNVWLSTQAALRLSIDILDAERAAPATDVLRQTAVRDVWALTSMDGRVVGLYRTGRLEELMHDFLHEISPAGIVFVAYPPDERADGEAVAAGPWLPGWQLSFVPLDPKALDIASSRRRTVYISAAFLSVAMMALVGVAAGGWLRRHLELARLKTDLAAAASHELRTPLASMRVLVDGLLADDVPDAAKTREYLQLLAAENARLSRLIENLLTFSRLDRHLDQFVLAPVEPATVAAAAVEAIRDRVPRTCEICVDVNGDLPFVRADVDALTTALVNLLDNALKYTPAEKRIMLRVHDDRGKRVCFAVTDNGIGIPAGERRRIFRRFYRVDRVLSQATSGVGLGLSIVELIVRGHRGTVTVKSNEERGSTFTISLPAIAKAL